ncbi:MAG: M23 family metallopeptidase [Actinobacteria bacterium]|nr:M23 family metallopeptidase [Actinomycetota bacterium]
MPARPANDAFAAVCTRPRVNRYAIAGLAPVLAAALSLPAAVDRTAAARPSAVEAQAMWVDASNGMPRAPAPEPVIEPFAAVEGVQLVEPAPTPVLIGFHQANGPRPIALTPDVAAHQILPSRGRGTHATSAVDIVLPAAEPVRATVSGTVVAANRYALYGQTSDGLVEIVPHANPAIRVRLLHLAELQVTAGEHVVAGETVVAATARTLPFGSQIDTIVGQRLPHVHVEVVR